jgi:phage shock protein E
MKNKTILLSLVFLGILFYTIWWAYHYAIDSPLRIPTAEARRRISKGDFDVIMDVRTDLELQTLGKYPGSVHIQAKDIKEVVPTQYPDKSIRILLYCNSGQRSRTAAENLQALGYKNAVYYAGPYQSLL